MTTLKSKIQHTLDESRTLILGVQVLMGINLEFFLTKGFDGLDRVVQTSCYVNLIFLLLSFALLALPPAFHRIVNRGYDSNKLLAVSNITMGCVLFPIALSLGLEMFISASVLFSSAIAASAGCGTFLYAMGFWYGRTFYCRYQSAPREGRQRMKPTGVRKSNLRDRIQHVLAEIRMVLPGAQALLGFYLLVTLQQPFLDQPPIIKTIHYCGLSLNMLSIVGLMMPSAFHRIVEEGNDTEEFHACASRYLVWSMSLLALGMCAAFYVVTYRLSASYSLSLAAMLSLAVVFYALWFGYTRYVRHKRVSAMKQRAAARTIHLGNELK